MKFENYVIELPDYPVVNRAAAEQMILEVITMTAEANVGLDRDTIRNIATENKLSLKDVEMFIDRILTGLYNTHIFSQVLQVKLPLSNVSVHVRGKCACVEITWNDKLNQDHT